MLRKNFRSRKQARRQVVLKNREEQDKRTPNQQLARLDDMFGKDQGAGKERAKLAVLQEKGLGDKSFKDIREGK